MTDKSLPKIVIGRSLPRVRCRICGAELPLGDTDKKIGKFPRHERLDEPELKCPRGGKPLKKEDFIDR